MRTAHFTNFGCTSQPQCADADGYLCYREGFERLPEDEWTPAEAWIASMTRQIDEWREGC